MEDLQQHFCNSLTMFHESLLHTWSLYWPNNTKHHLNLESKFWTDNSDGFHPVSSTTLCLKMTLMLHIVTSTHINWLCNFLAQMLLTEYAIEWWFVFPPLLTMSLHYLRKCWNAKIASFLSHAVLVLVYCQTSTVTGLIYSVLILINYAVAAVWLSKFRYHWS